MLRRLSLLLLVACAQAQSPDASDWGYTGGDILRQRYSSLAEIHRENVAKLTVAWQFRTGELGQGFARADRLAFEATPVLAFGLLYLATPTDIVIALDPATGHARWRYDPRIDRKRRYAEATSRGVSVWETPQTGGGSTCARRVFIGTLDARLIALDADKGALCADFGSRGSVDLTEGLRIHDPNDHVVISPPVAYDGLIIVGLPTGPIRAFDARTGALRWQTQTDKASGAMSVDPDRGLIFAPSGSSLLALEGASGKQVWRHELVHHDLWGFDLTAPPVLIGLEQPGLSRSAVLQAAKTGMLFAFARNSGAPLFPVVEQRVPGGRSGGVQAAPTQPFPTTPPLVAQTPIAPEDAWGITFWDRSKCRKLIARHRNEGVFTPPDERGTIQLPGPFGGIGWGGVAFDEHQQLAFAAINHLPMLVTLIPPSEVEPQRRSGRFPRAEFFHPEGARHAVRREPLLSPWALPCTAPPWGTLASVDLRNNQIVWQVPLGSTEKIGPWFAPTRDFGTPNLGGPIVTAGDLVFVGAAMDSYFRAFDAQTGRELWRYKLPAGGQATPMTYRAGADHRQFVVIAAGGNGELGTPRGDYVVAFALPK